jgi:acetyltransferase-like isoleucine patch superfamily enzyme
MIIKFFRRAVFHAKKILFWLEHGRRFKKYDYSSTIYDAIRINGHKHISIGKKVFIHSGVWLEVYMGRNRNPLLEIGDNTAIGNFNQITAINKVIIKEFVLIADGVYIADNTHEYSRTDVPIIEQGIEEKKSVTIERGAWIGRNAIILGASVGKNSVVGANSVVIQDVPDYCVAAGAPAKIIKRFDFNERIWKPENISNSFTHQK